MTMGRHSGNWRGAITRAGIPANARDAGTTPRDITPAFHAHPTNINEENQP